MTRLYCSQGHDNPVDNRFCRECGEKLMAVGGSYQPGLVGQLLGLRYRVMRELGHGGFGRTYLAEDNHRFSELCVLKEFSPQVQGSQALHKAEELFEREAGVLYKLQHPQIPRFRELFRAHLEGSGRLFLVQDYVAGQTYQEILQTRSGQGQCFTEMEATQLLVQLLPVLSYIHSCGVVHRDISPDNLILRNSDRLPVLIDFGGVKQVAATVASQVHQPIASVRAAKATRLGKAGYAPAEQMDTGEAHPHSDLYALGVTVLVLLTGKEPQELLGNDRRQWKRQVKLSPKLTRVLERLLDPYPTRRYQSAQEVLQALGAGSVIPQQSLLPAAFIPAPPTSDPFPNTIAVAPAASMGYSPAYSQVHPTATTPAYSPTPRRSSEFVSGFLRTITTLLVIAGVSAGGWWAVNRWLIPYLESPPVQRPKPAPAKSTASNNGATVPEFSKAEQRRKQTIDQRRRDLGVDEGFFVSLVDEEFYAKHAIGRPLSSGSADAALRADWDKLAQQLLDRLQTISANARSRLGNYTDADLEKRRNAVNQRDLSSRALNDLTDARFFYLFPDQSQTQDLLQKPIGQVWQAIAADQLKAIQAGTALEQIQLPTGQFSQRVNGTLKPGTGKAYLARLTKDQVMRVQLQAPDRALRLSIYPPTSKSPALLEDADETEWTGKLAESGLYEVVIVSTASDPIDYELDLAAADNMTLLDESR